MWVGKKTAMPQKSETKNNKKVDEISITQKSLKKTVRNNYVVKNISEWLRSIQIFLMKKLREEPKKMTQQLPDMTANEISHLPIKSSSLSNLNDNIPLKNKQVTFAEVHGDTYKRPTCFNEDEMQKFHSKIEYFENLWRTLYPQNISANN